MWKGVLLLVYIREIHLTNTPTTQFNQPTTTVKVPAKHKCSVSISTDREFHK